MTNKKYEYEYMDEASISSDLMCSICSKPFNQPISAPCKHTFCRECIDRWIGKNNKTCPICRSQIRAMNEFIPVCHPFQNMLDRLKIKCSTCNQTDLQRDNFNDHINKICPKVNVFCSAADIKCSWTGLREQLSTHLTVCKYEPLRSILTQLMNENKQLLNEQIKQNNIQMNETTNRLLTISNHQYLHEKLIENETDLIIDYSQQKITDRYLTALIPQIINKQCIILQLQSNAITSQGILICIKCVEILIDKFLRNSTTLHHLHLGSNCITDRGIFNLVEMLKRNRTLTDLWLYDNQITDRGVNHLANTLKNENRNLKHLDLQWNRQVTDSCVESLANMFERNQILERLNLRKCNLTMADNSNALYHVVVQHLGNTYGDCGNYSNRNFFYYFTDVTNGKVRPLILRIIWL
ncbi:hypothetical protein I4U23_019895 [Adineta vaga]|nr:hypothetical protein I4U23_019895 [Adineta vaga]